ncbi:MAG TPA: hypothetical protein DCZ94_07340 [Lentisphaeria bacterium]|nr:MAG: hypothetical protein A2X48_20485 [Lentisphaerae bacterium GWF2_49_21]HBC86749.1 hypothetical protein [Lentisphaeria bacterium]
MKTTRMILISAVFAGMLLASCKSKDEVRMGVVTELEHFPKIRNVNAELDIVSPARTFNINEPALLIFRFTNYSTKRLVVYEWKMVDEYNVRLYLTPWSEGKPVPPPDQWICLKPEIKKPRLMTLDLGLDNFTLVEKRIDFKKDIIKGEIEKPRTFLVYGELNLESVNLKTNSTVLTITP